MARLLIVTYRPVPGQLQAVVDLLRAQYQRVLSLGILPGRPPLLARSAAGEISYIATFAHPDEIDRCWEDLEFQDLDARLAEIAEMVPARALSEACASYMDLEALEPPSLPTAALPSASHGFELLS